MLKILLTLIAFGSWTTSDLFVPMPDLIEKTGTVKGSIIDADSRESVPFAYVHLEQINRTTTSDKDGRFQLSGVPEGVYTLTVHRIGYVTQNRTIEVSPDSEIEILIELKPTILTGQAVEVVADAEHLVGANLEHASVKISGEQLRRDLGSTLSETLDNQPGFSQRTMGAAPGRPVMRGLGDERVMILEDGQVSGDVSWTSPDHAVSIDPSSANEIQIARGPAALEYGANAIGGVINVVSNQIPNTLPSNITGSGSFQGSSVNQGLTGSGSITVPFNDFVFNLNVSGRTGQDFDTPIGRINNTYLQTGNSAFGFSYVRPWGYAGLSGSMYYSEYGIPPDSIAGHADGVDIEMVKYQVDGRSEITFSDSFFNLLELRGSFTSYNHVEIESTGAIGTEYGMLQHTGSVKARYRNLGFIDSGVIGISAEIVDYAVFGSGTPNSNSYEASVFTIQESDFGNLHIETGFRFEYNLSRPENEWTSTIIGDVRERSFYALSSSLSAIYDAGKGFHIGSTFMHSFRPPSLEELFSEGPHLATYSFEVGNPELDAERGFGSELFVRYNSSWSNFELAGYHNFFRNYIHVQDTGEQNHRFPSLNNWQFVGTEATIYGIEFSTELQLLERFVLEGTYSYTIGNRVVTEEEKAITGLEESNQPLPMIPPMKGNIGLRYSFNDLSIGSRLRLTASQDRLGEFETATDGYQVLDLNAQYRFNWGNTFHTLTLNLLNIFDEEYYNHLSRVKEIYPEQGRSVNLLYRVYF